MRQKKIILLLLLVTFIKQITWASLVPLWHFPDEQAHFGQIAFLAEVGRMPYADEMDLTEEIRKSEELLGTERDQLGINKFTYHPQYRIQYSDTTTGLDEKNIQNLALDPKGRFMVKQESSRYKPLYYQSLAFIYRLLYFQDLFVRVFVIRILQIIFSIGTVFIAWKIGMLLFPRVSFLAITLAMFASFQPMFSFVAAGINSDNIGNFAFTLYLLIALRFLKTPSSIQWFKSLNLFLVTVLAVYFKLQFLIVVPLTVLVFLYAMFKSFKSLKGKTFSLISFLPGVAIVALFLIKFQIAPSAVFYRFLNNFHLMVFFDYLKNYAFIHLYREVLPWYWGIYDWLGVTYPRPVHRIINWTILFSLLGFAVWVVKSIKERKWPFAGILFLLLTSGFLFLGIYLYDWLEFFQREIHLGVQGRYFFPTISAHMAILLLGLVNLVPERFRKWRLKVALLVGLAIVLLNFYALYTVAKAYYTLWPISTFIIQVSQYKPWFLKGFWLVGLLIIYLITIGIFLVEYIQSSHEKKN